jgi:hypothetical protein
LSRDREELRRQVFDYVEIFYNAGRRHTTLGVRSAVRDRSEYSLDQLNNDNRNQPRVQGTSEIQPERSVATASSG